MGRVSVSGRIRVGNQIAVDLGVSQFHGVPPSAFLSVLVVAAFVLPGVEQMDDDLLHLLRGVVLGEIPLHVLLIEEELLPLVGLFLGEQVMQVFTGQRSRSGSSV